MLGALGGAVFGSNIEYRGDPVQYAQQCATPYAGYGDQVVYAAVPAPYYYGPSHYAPVGVSVNLGYSGYSGYYGGRHGYRSGRSAS